MIIRLLFIIHPLGLTACPLWFPAAEPCCAVEHPLFLVVDYLHTVALQQHPLHPLLYLARVAGGESDHRFLLSGVERPLGALVAVSYKGARYLSRFGEEAIEKHVKVSRVVDSLLACLPSRRILDDIERVQHLVGVNRYRVVKIPVHLRGHIRHHRTT